MRRPDRRRGALRALKIALLVILGAIILIYGSLILFPDLK